MKLGDPILPVGPESNYDKQLNRWITDFVRKLVTKVNGMASGKFADAADNAATAAPTSGAYVQGDFIANSNPTELGTAGSKYVLMGWKCVASGTPGTWVQCRVLTGG